MEEFFGIAILVLIAVGWLISVSMEFLKDFYTDPDEDSGE